MPETTTAIQPITREQALYMAEAMLGWETIDTDRDKEEIQTPVSPVVRLAVGVMLGVDMPNIFDLQQNASERQRRKTHAFTSLLRSMADALEGGAN